MRSKFTYANVMATIAVFIALGGSAYAFHLGRNSVGSKQLKKNAVITAKIKKEAVTAAKVRDGTLTGKQINASTLGEVPSAAQAGNAATLGGSPSSDFAKSSRFLFGHGAINATSQQTLFTVPGDFSVKTNGKGEFKPYIVVEGLSAERWDFYAKESSISWSSSGVKAGQQSEIEIGHPEAGVIYAVGAEHPARQAVIFCTYDFNSGELLCSATLSPSA